MTPPPQSPLRSAMEGLADRIESEAAIADRPGQMVRLQAIAYEVRALAAADGAASVGGEGIAEVLAAHQWHVSRWSGGGWTWGCSCRVHDWGTAAENPARYERHPTREAARLSAAAHLAAVLVAAGVTA